MTFEYIEIEEIAKERNWTTRILLRHCYSKSIKLYTYVLATKYKVKILREDLAYNKTYELLIDRKYLAIDRGSIDDLSRTEKNKPREVKFQYQTSNDYPNAYLEPIDPDDRDLSNLQLYIKASDLKKLDETIQPEEHEPVIGHHHEEANTEKLLNKINKPIDQRHNIEMQKIAEALASQFISDKNGQIPSKKLIAVFMSRQSPTLGSYETILRRIKMSWKPTKSQIQRTIS